MDGTLKQHTQPMLSNGYGRWFRVSTETAARARKPLTQAFLTDVFHVSLVSSSKCQNFAKVLDATFPALISEGVLAKGCHSSNMRRTYSIDDTSAYNCKFNKENIILSYFLKLFYFNLYLKGFTSSYDVNLFHLRDDAPWEYDL